MKKSVKIKNFPINNFELEDVVYLREGSGLTCIGFPEKDFYIVESYPNITASERKLQDIPGVIVEVGVKDWANVYLDTIYPQDIVIQLGKALFRTNSYFVSKEEPKSKSTGLGSFDFGILNPYE